MTTPDPEVISAEGDSTGGEVVVSTGMDFSGDESDVLYHISFDRLEGLRRSPVALIADRRVESCPSMLTPLHELDDPQVLIEEIAEHCGDGEDFIHSNMAVQEIIFRTLLANGNKPMSLEALHYELTERWSTPLRPITLAEESLESVLDADDYYGFSRVQQEEGN